MDRTSQRAVEEEVESHAPPVIEAGGRGQPAPLVPEAPAQSPQAMFYQMAEFFRKMAKVMPSIPLLQQKSYLKKLIKFGAVDFLGKKEAENQSRTWRVLCPCSKMMHISGETQYPVRCDHIR